MSRAFPEPTPLEPSHSPADAAAATNALTSHAQTSADIVCSSLASSLVDAWLDHCAECFKEKKPHPPPRAYFKAHLEEDPMRDLNGIAIVRCAENPPEPPKPLVEGEDPPPPFVSQAIEGRVIASTTRVFVRRQYLEGKKVSIAGLGEVATKAGYRKRGYAELAMERSLAYARKLRLQLAGLHASSALAQFYTKQKFQSVPRWFGIKSTFEQEKDVNIVGEGLRSGEFALRVMPVNQFLSPALLPQFQAMYDSFSPRFNGTVVRTDEYWHTWVQSDLQSSIGSNYRFPIEIYAAYREWDGSEPAPNPPSPIQFLSYLFLQRVPNPLDDGSANRDRIYVVREYCALPEWVDRPDGGRQMFLSLVQYAVRQIRHKFIEIDADAAAKAKLAVKFPLPLTAKFAKPLTVDSEECDEGFLYQPLPLDFTTNPADDSSSAQSVQSTFRGASLEQTPIRSPFAASPFVLHDMSEPMSASSAEELLAELQTEAKRKVVFWGTDAF